MASDDYDALSPESLGAAFLARAIDAPSDVDDDALDGIEQDLPGLRISTGPDALATDSEEDQAANEILYGSGAPRDGSGTPRGRARG